ncbi:hypothetical protein BD779DRAFT_1611996 [Infundibulicybe gibba]|nr:hypothetical protein BD779DRAFT_1611996 [Infundibulicybe gibba]
MSDVASNLPPSRTKKATKPVSPPLSSGSLHRFIYVLVILTTLLAAYYSWRIAQWKSNVGGWKNLAFGPRGTPVPAAKTHTTDTVESRINALAEALGMPPKHLASAIAVAVREHVPPPTGPVVDTLVGGKESKESGDPGVVEGVVSGMESFVGMDEP